MLFAKVLQDWDKFFIYPRRVSAWFSDNRSSILFVEEALQNKGKSCESLECFAASQNLFPFLLGPITSAPILLSMETNLKNQRMLVWAEVDVKLGPVTPLHILPKMESDDRYTIQNRNPKLQPNRPAQFLQQALPSLPYLKIQVGQAGQSSFEKLSRPIWL